MVALLRGQLYFKQEEKRQLRRLLLSNSVWEQNVSEALWERINHMDTCFPRRSPDPTDGIKEEALILAFRVTRCFDSPPPLPFDDTLTWCWARLGQVKLTPGWEMSQQKNVLWNLLSLLTNETYSHQHFFFFLKIQCFNSSINNVRKWNYGLKVRLKVHEQGVSGGSRGKVSCSWKKRGQL